MRKISVYLSHTAPTVPDGLWAKPNDKGGFGLFAHIHGAWCPIEINIGEIDHSAFDKAGAAEEAKQQVIGKSSDASSAKTINGVTKLINEKESALNSKISTINNTIDDLKKVEARVKAYVDEQISNLSTY